MCSASESFPTDLNQTTTEWSSTIRHMRKRDTDLSETIFVTAGRDVHFSSKTRISSHHYSVTHKQKPILDRRMKLYLRAINLSCIDPVWHISYNIFSKQLFPDISRLTCRALLFHFFVCQFSGVVLLPLYCFALCKNLLTPQRNIFPSNRGRKNK